MPKRIKRPINRRAFELAQEQFRSEYCDELADEDGIFQRVQPSHKKYKKYRNAWLKMYRKHGGETITGWGEDVVQEPGDPVEPCPYRNKIRAVYILDGDEDTYLTRTGVQHVNLPVEEKWVDGETITNMDRLSRQLRVKVEFERDLRERFGFKVQLLAHQTNAEYTERETRALNLPYGRTASDRGQGEFTIAHGDFYEGKTTKQGRGTCIVEGEFEVTPAVGDRYKFVAWDQTGKQVYSEEIRTQRTLFLMTLHTRNATAPRDFYVPAIQAVYEQVHTELIDLGHVDLGEWHVDPMAPLDFLNSVNESSEAVSPNTDRTYSDYHPFLLRFTFVDQMATPVHITTQPAVGVRVGPGSDAVRLPVKARDAPERDRDADMRKPLWVGLGEPTFSADKPTPDTNEWYVSANVQFENGEVVEIPHTNFTPIEADPGNAPGIYKDVDVQVDNLVAPQPTGDVRLTAVVVNRMVLGLAKRPESPGTMIMASRHHGRVRDEQQQISAAIHEVGHWLRMVPTLDECGIETPVKHYLSDGHHCHFGIPDRDDGRYQSDPNAVNQAQCVMFGFIATIPLIDFCTYCRAALRKVDISEGLRA